MLNIEKLVVVGVGGTSGADVGVREKSLEGVRGVGWVWEEGGGCREDKRMWSQKWKTEAGSDCAWR